MNCSTGNRREYRLAIDQLNTYLKNGDSAGFSSLLDEHVPIRKIKLLSNILSPVPKEIVQIIIEYEKELRDCSYWLQKPSIFEKFEDPKKYKSLKSSLPTRSKSSQGSKWPQDLFAIAFQYSLQEKENKNRQEICQVLLESNAPPYRGMSLNKFCTIEVYDPKVLYSPEDQFLIKHSQDIFIHLERAGEEEQSRIKAYKEKLIFQFYENSKSITHCLRLGDSAKFAQVIEEIIPKRSYRQFSILSEFFKPSEFFELSSKEKIIFIILNYADLETYLYLKCYQEVLNSNIYNLGLKNISSFKDITYSQWESVPKLQDTNINFFALATQYYFLEKNKEKSRIEICQTLMDTGINLYKGMSFNKFCTSEVYDPQSTYPPNEQGLIQYSQAIFARLAETGVSEITARKNAYIQYLTDNFDKRYQLSSVKRVCDAKPPNLHDLKEVLSEWLVNKLESLEVDMDGIQGQYYDNQPLYYRTVKKLVEILPTIFIDPSLLKRATIKINELFPYSDRDYCDDYSSDLSDDKF